MSNAGSPLLRTKSHFIAQLILGCLIKANSLPSWPQPGPWIISLEVHRLKGSCSLESPLNLRPNSIWKAELKPSSPHDQVCSACVLKIGAFYLKINRVSHIKPMDSQKKKYWRKTVTYPPSSRNQVLPLTQEVLYPVQPRPPLPLQCNSILTFMEKVFVFLWFILKCMFLGVIPSSWPFESVVCHWSYCSSLFLLDLFS